MTPTTIVTIAVATINSIRVKPLSLFFIIFNIIVDFISMKYFHSIDYDFRFPENLNLSIPQHRIEWNQIWLESNRWFPDLFNSQYLHLSNCTFLYSDQRYFSYFLFSTLQISLFVIRCYLIHIHRIPFRPIKTDRTIPIILHRNRLRFAHIGVQISRRAVQALVLQP